MEHVVSTPELIDMIFAYMSRKEHAVTALVCKRWLEHSRDQIWYNVKNPTELFPLLAPLKTSSDLDTVRTPVPAMHERCIHILAGFCANSS